MSVSEYMADISTEPVVEEVKAKKRKREQPDESELAALKQRARVYVKCPEQWKCIGRYNAKRLTEWLEEQEFSQSKALHASVFGFVHTLWALTLDTLTRGDGHVRQEIENDLSLRQCIEEEGARFVALLNNKCKLAALSSVGVFNGKKIQRLHEPPEQAHVEEIEAEAVPGADHSQAVCDELGGEERERQDTVMPETTA